MYAFSVLMYSLIITMAIVFVVSLHENLSFKLLLYTLYLTERDAVEYEKWRTQVSEVGCLHVAGLLFKDGSAATRERVHVCRDGADGHVAWAGRVQDGMMIPRGGVGQHCSACWEEDFKDQRGK